MNILVIIVASFFLALEGPTFFASQIKYLKEIYHVNRLKPFDCEPCFGFWLSLIISLIETDLLTALLVSTIVFQSLKRYLTFFKK
jgi:hypothetical protein